MKNPTYCAGYKLVLIKPTIASKQSKSDAPYEAMKTTEEAALITRQKKRKKKKKTSDIY